MHRPGADDREVVSVVDWLLDTSSLQEFLQRLVDDAVQVSGADGCGVTLQRRDRPLTVISTGSLADKLDEKQYGQDDGPCLEALRTGRVVRAPDLLDESRWRQYPDYAASLGVRAALSVPIPAHTHTVGALNFYATEPHAFTDQDEQRLGRFAAQAGGGIALAQRLADAEDFTRELQTAIRSRSLIDQAIGVVMHQERCRAEQAFDLLRRLSQESNTKLRDVCARLVTGVGGHPPKAQPPLRRRQ